MKRCFRFIDVILKNYINKRLPWILILTLITLCLISYATVNSDKNTYKAYPSIIAYYNITITNNSLINKSYDLLINNSGIPTVRYNISYYNYTSSSWLYASVDNGVNISQYNLSLPSSQTTWLLKINISPTNPVSGNSTLNISLYNGSRKVLTLEDHAIIESINLTSPVASATAPNGSPSFMFNIFTGSDNSQSCSLYIGDVANGSLTATNSSLNEIQPDSTLADASYFWKIGCTSGSNLGYSETRKITVTAPPIIALISPNNNINTTNINNTFIFSASDNGGSDILCNLTIDNIVNISNINITSGASNTTMIPNFGQGNHYWNVSCWDTNGNYNATIGRNFTVDTTEPTLSITPTNGTNITTTNEITITTIDTYTAVKTRTWTTSCGGSGNYESGKTFYPFNHTSKACSLGGSYRTLTINSSDHVGKFNSSTYIFGADSTGPIITAVSPSDGTEITNDINLNFSAQDDFVKISYVGYYLNNDPIVNITLSGSTSGLGEAASSYAENATITLSAGNHSLIFSANDTLGNWRNSSTIYFIVRSNINVGSLSSGLNSHLGTELSMAPIFRTKNESGSKAYNTTSGSPLSNSTFEILFNVNSTGTPINVTLTDLEGSSVNWGKINSSYIRSNNTEAYAGVMNNWTNTIYHLIYVNDSFSDFAKNNNKYYGTILMPMLINISNNSKSSVNEFWWIEDENNLQSRTNISKCDSVFTPTTPTPCWNYTTNSRTLIYVPHFSVIVASNDTTAPTITYRKPSSIQNINHFAPNITVSSDTTSCKYIFNGSTENTSMNVAGTFCYGSIVAFQNLAQVDGNYNVTFYAIDGAGNIQTSTLKFNVSDNTAPGIGSVTSYADKTEATITITGCNESVNATAYYGLTQNSLSGSAFQTDFESNQAILIPNLARVSSETTWYYNLTICDLSGNCNKTGGYTFTQDGTASSTTSASGSGGGGGGGGGAATSSNTQASQARLWSSIIKDSSIDMSITKSDIAITQIIIQDIKKDLSNVEIKIASLIEKPYSADAAEKVYQYLEIVAKNIDDDDATTIKIKFKVPKSWLSANGVAQDNIALWHYDSGWNMLDTTLLYSEGEYHSFESDTPGFSFFAIGSKTTVKKKDLDIVEKENITEEIIIEPESQSEKPKRQPPKPKTDTTVIPWAIIILLIAISVIIFFEFIRRKQKK